MMTLPLSRDALRAVFEASVDAMVVCDQFGMILLWNSAAARIFGYPAHEMIGQPVSRLIPLHLVSSHENGMKRLRDGDPPRLVGQMVEVPALCCDGREIPIELSLGRWSQGEEPRYIAVMRDGSERRMLQQERDRHARMLEQRNAQLARLVFAAAHTLQEPQRTLLGLTHALSDELEGHSTSSVVDILRHMEVTAERASRITRALLELSTVGTRPTQSNLSLDAILWQVLAELEPPWPPHAAICIHQLPRVDGDPQDWALALRALIKNSLAHHPNDRPIRMTLRSEVIQDGLTLYLDDNGDGIPEAQQEDAFNLFNRMGGPDVGALGTGLALVRAAIESIEGQVSLHDAPSGGLRVRITLPGLAIASS